MSEILSPTIAKIYARELMVQLETKKFLDYEGKRVFPTSPLFRDQGGIMFAVAVAIDDVKGEIVVYKAFSGEYLGTASISGFVPPTYDEDEYHALIKESDAVIKQLQKEGNFKEAKSYSAITQQKVHEMHRFHCIDGSINTLNDLIPDRIMPSGTGDCCGPKLLSEIFKKGLRVVSMVEFFYGNDAQHMYKEFYPPCESRCEPLLSAMVGLSILYVDQHIIVVNKSEGLLSVPGIGPEKSDCVVSRVKRLVVDCIDSPSVHRLDMDTSGLLVLGLTKEAQRDLSIQFMERKVRKSYIALLDGILMQESGSLTLSFRLDVDNRPYQIYDEQKGKVGTTHYKRIKVEPYKDRHATRVEFTPKTGRTHQLRIHSAHEKGLSMPIIGDRLYGKREDDERLMLHAVSLSFTHPYTHEKMEFTTNVPF